MDRDERGRFVNGNQAGKAENGGNGGKPKGLAEQARAAVRDGGDLIAFYLAVFKGEQGAELSDRLTAAQWFADRGWGKAAQFINVDATGEIRVYTGLDVEKV